MYDAYTQNIWQTDCFRFSMLAFVRRFWNWTVQQKQSNVMNPKHELFVAQTVKLMRRDAIWCVHSVPDTKWI